MAIKEGKKRNFKEAVQNKVKTTTGNQIIIIDDSDDASYSDLQAEVKVKKKKHLVKGKGSDRKGAKKKKKKKVDSELKNKVCANFPIITESNSDSKLLKETRKIPEIVKKKGDKRLSCEQERDGAVHSEELSEEHQGGNFLIGEARKRNIPNCHGNDNEFTPKKKKKRKHKPACSSLLHDGNSEGESKKQISPNPKSISQEMFPNRKWTLVQLAAGNSDMVKKKKVASYLTSSNGISDKGIATEYQLKEEHSCKGRAFGCKQQEDAAHILEEESQVIKKKKKQKLIILLASASNQENHSGVSDENLKKSKSKKKPVISKDEIGLILDSKGANKVTEKKKIQAKVVRSQPAVSADSKDVSTNERESAKKRRKKKTKKSKGTQNGIVRSDDGRFESSSKQHVKKRKDGEDKGFRDSLEEPSLKKARIKIEAKEGEEEIKVVAFKKGNCDEINIDKLRRQALQEEIDRESGKTQVIKEEDELGDYFGQWSTATFESSERKAKFLRLLGGFKKGSAAAQDSLAPAPKPNMALGKSREQNLQRNLQVEFEKAVDWKHHRGIGIGFRPAPQHMRIDKYASKSIKFEV